MSEEEKGGSGREQGLEAAATSVRALRESLSEAGASVASGPTAPSTPSRGQADASAGQGGSQAIKVEEAVEGAVPAESKAGAASGRVGAAGSKAGEAAVQPEAKGESKNDGKPESKNESKPESKNESKPESKNESKASEVSATGQGSSSAAAGLGAAGRSASSSSTARAPASATRELEDELDDEEVSRELGGGAWRRWAALGGLVVAALGIGATVLLGQRNSERYLLRCAAEHIVAEHGRGFPPWGERRLSGKQWKPIPLPLAAECRTRQAQSEVELAGWYAEALMEQAGQVLAAGKLDQLEAAAAQLEQAALLTRAPERRAERAQLQRLWGDVEYGRALAKLAEARQALAEAARGLDEAAKKEPRYATDAAARARELRRLLAELGAPGLAEAGAPVSPLPAVSEPSSASPPAIPDVPAGATSAPEATGPAPLGPPAPTAPAPTEPVAPAGASGSSPGAADAAAPDAEPTPVPAGGVLL